MFMVFILSLWRMMARLASKNHPILAKSNAALDGRECRREGLGKTLAIVRPEEGAERCALALAHHGHRRDAEFMVTGDVEAGPERVIAAFAHQPLRRDLANPEFEARHR